MHTQQLFIVPKDYDKQKLDGHSRVASLYVLNHLKSDASAPYYLESRRTISSLPKGEMIRLVPHIKNEDYASYPKFTDVLLVENSSDFFKTIDETKQIPDSEFFKALSDRKMEKRSASSSDSPSPKKRKMPETTTGGGGHSDFIAKMLKFLSPSDEASERNNNWINLQKLSYPAWFCLVGLLLQSDQQLKHVKSTIVHMDPVLSIFMLLRNFEDLRTTQDLSCEKPDGSLVEKIQNILVSNHKGGSGLVLDQAVSVQDDAVYRESFEAISRHVTDERENSGFKFEVGHMKNNSFNDEFVLKTCRAACDKTTKNQEVLLGYANDYCVGSIVGTAKALYRLATLINGYVKDGIVPDVAIFSLTVCSYGVAKDVEDTKAISDPYTLIGCFTNYLGGLFNHCYAVQANGGAFDGPIKMGGLIAPVLHYSGGEFNVEVSSKIF